MFQLILLPVAFWHSQLESVIFVSIFYSQLSNVLHCPYIYINDPLLKYGGLPCIFYQT